MQRSGYSKVNAKLRIASQMPLENKVARANFVIDNSGTKSNMRDQTIKVINVLKCSRHHWLIRFIIGCSCLILLGGAYWLIGRYLNKSLSTA